MFESFRKFLPEVSEGRRHPAHFEHNDYRLAAAALLVHTAAIDANMSDLERDKLHAVVKRQFGLDEATTGELVAEATEMGASETSRQTGPRHSVAAPPGRFAGRTWARSKERMPYRRKNHTIRPDFPSIR
jgi:tellurite resistance protein